MTITDFQFAIGALVGIGIGVTMGKHRITIFNREKRFAAFAIALGVGTLLTFASGMIFS